jgi:KDO2-lipid IV(A) lauroyltransferase
MRHVLELLFFLLFSAPLAILPLSLSRKAGELLGLLVYFLWGGRRRIAVENLRAAVGRNAVSISRSPESVIRENFRHMGRSFSEVVRIYYGLGGRIVKGIKFQGLENYETAKAEGRGVIFITGHCGNWELMLLALNTRVGSISPVARRQNNPYLNSFIEKARERFGAKVIYKRGALRKLLSVLKEGGIVGVIMDQSVLPEEGVVMDFLGAPAWITKMPAALARRTSASVVPVFIRRNNGVHEITVHPAVELVGEDAEDTKRMSRYMEDYIRENPSEWLWMHRKWKRTEALRAKETV